MNATHALHAVPAPGAAGPLLRPRRPAPLPPAEPLPLDVRVTEGVARAVFGLAGALLLAAAVTALLRAPLFPIRHVVVDGDVARNSAAALRANALPQLAGNFFGLDLQRARAAFESVPWVRRAVLRRVWPDRLLVRLEEHRPAAVWLGEEGADRLVNSFGEVFEANLGDVEEDGLPELQGPDGSAPRLLAMAGRLQPLLERMDLRLQTLRLSGRGSWRAELDSGAAIELGRGSDDEVLARTERFVRTLPQVTGTFRQPLLHADLRHADGYALRLRGVTTAPAAPVAAPPRPTARR